MEFEKPKQSFRESLVNMPKNDQILLGSGVSAVVFIFIAIIIGNAKLYGIFLGLGIITAFAPYSLVTYFEKKRLVDIEENFPEFLRDLAEARKIGMTLPQAIYKSAKVDYGRLSPEIQKMANQISWGVPFNDVLKKFSERMKSKFIERAIAIIVEAQVSGGDVTDTLESVARDARLIKESEKERSAKLDQQTMIMYAIFFLFLAIVVALQRLMMPLVASKGFTLSAESPKEILDFYKNLFFSMIVIQAIFNGLLAGQISKGSAVIGLKHSAIFLVAGVVVSWVMIFR